MITAKVHGMAELSAKLLKMQIQAPGLMKAALLKAAEPIREEAQVLAPVSTHRWTRKGVTPGAGHLAKGIKIRLMPSTSPGHERVRIGVKDSLWYGVFPEFGTAHMAAHPFLRPALDIQTNEALRIFRDELKRRLT